MRLSRLARTAPALLVALSLAACGGSSSDDGSASSTPSPSMSYATEVPLPPVSEGRDVLTPEAVTSALTDEFTKNDVKFKIVKIKGMQLPQKAIDGEFWAAGRVKLDKKGKNTVDFVAKSDGESIVIVDYAAKKAGCKVVSQDVALALALDC